MSVIQTTSYQPVAIMLTHVDLLGFAISTGSLKQAKVRHPIFISSEGTTPERMEQELKFQVSQPRV